jgi:hypothetical protein
MRRFKGECAHFRFIKCPIYTHDGASVKYNTNSHETDNSVHVCVCLNFDLKISPACVKVVDSFTHALYTLIDKCIYASNTFFVVLSLCRDRYGELSLVGHWFKKFCFFRFSANCPESNFIYSEKQSFFKSILLAENIETYWPRRQGWMVGPKFAC